MVDFAVIRKVAKELNEFRTNGPADVKVILTDDMTDIQAWIKGPGYFLTKIFHPNVSAQGEICVSTLKKDWKKELGIGHVLLTIKCLLIDPNPESALNEEAGRLILEDYESFSRHAKIYTSVHANAPVPSPFPADSACENRVPSQQTPETSGTAKGLVGTTGKPGQDNSAVLGDLGQSNVIINPLNCDEGQVKKVAAESAAVTGGAAIKKKSLRRL
ncbi:ubiquitin-conjugating enzyme E2 S [Blyttiomyces sp. JEL0837]|nr:ubiquitin-conjugating enzyme E2 S [Blyttiomyces sp. JEL0837]